MATYIISDIHGCIQTLRMLIEGKLKVSLQDRLFFLGDYIDRGPDSSAVVEYIIGLMRSGYTISCLMGNHEQMMLDSVKGESELCLWQANSGQATIKSYVKMFGFDDDGHLGFLPKAHLDFFTSLKQYFIVDDKYILVHGGLNTTAANPLEDTEAMLWSRLDDAPNDFMQDYRRIHGHTPEALDVIADKLKQPNRRIFGLDAGCVYRGMLFPGTGYLVALALDKWELNFVECLDKW